MQTATPKRMIIGISGASGVTYGVRLLQLHRNAGVETHLVMSKTAEQPMTASNSAIASS